MFLSRLFLVLSPLLSRAAAYHKLSDETLKQLPRPGAEFDIKNGALLAPILRPRVSGTEGNVAVRQHFVDFFRNNLPEWTLEFHNSTSPTPTSNGKEVPFVNLILTRDPPGTHVGDVGRLTMVAHYDSKLTPKGFIGATDSAAPCAMLMHMAKTIDAALTKRWKASGSGLDDLDGPKGVQILLLDGEEAFKSWTDTDSLYGSRALAEDWEYSFHPAMSTYRNPLDAISLFVLLDLLGSKNPTVPSYFKTTHWAYKNMADIEARLRKLGLFKSSPNHPANMAKRKNKKPRREPNFLTEADKKDGSFLGGGIEDDHVPFMARGVDILHIIPSPFPKVWHELIDDGEHLDMNTVEDWTVLVAAFVAEWMELDEFFDFKAGKREEKVKAETVHEQGKTEFEIP
ncbi:glutaminyl-peptide cyclotransferase precursor [Westerdykella ornata]|uniref:Peptide hydrolase n=1 Tax=Westerdykella ornata TaxID=318751 RepID=A0A6A6JSL8_WESOR|nr:glutaminyl-peptide cyclotransferase precursor [Westerdykella ornata]KAF2279387.1 glutaminyl-peptide cyclotransferase precursor [Westerdykella ornata]